MTDNTVYTVVSDNDRPGTANSNGFFEKNAVLPNTPGASIDNTTYAVDDIVNGNGSGNGTGSFYEKNTIYESLLLDSQSNAGTALPLMDATLAAVGIATKWAREDHVHPFHGRAVLTADTTYYVRADGSDSNTGLSALTAFATVQKGIAALFSVDAQAFSLALDVGAGHWAGGPFEFTGGGVNAFVTISGAGSSLTSISCSVRNIGGFFFQNLTFDASLGDNFTGLRAGEHAEAIIGPDVHFASTAFCDAYAYDFGAISIFAPCSISGNKNAFFAGDVSGRYYNLTNDTITMVGTPIFSGGVFALIDDMQAHLGSGTISGAYTGPLFTMVGSQAAISGALATVTSGSFVVDPIDHAATQAELATGSVTALKTAGFYLDARQTLYSQTGALGDYHIFDGEAGGIGSIQIGPTGDSYNYYQNWGHDFYADDPGVSTFVIEPGHVSVRATTASTSTTTGALTVAGGVGIGGDVSIGGNINALGGIFTAISMRTVFFQDYTGALAYFQLPAAGGANSTLLVNRQGAAFPAFIIQGDVGQTGDLQQWNVNGGTALAKVTNSGAIISVTAPVDTNTTQLATTAYFFGQAGASNPLAAGTAAPGTSSRWSRQDHVHPTDTTRAPLASPAFTGTPTAPTAAANTNNTQIATTAYADAIAALKANLASPTFTGTVGAAAIAATGAVKSSGGALGYATGAGGTVTQATSKATGVTLSKFSGAITLNAAALASGAIVSFVMTNTNIAAGDVLVLNHISGGTIGPYLLNAQCAAGSATINVRNTSAASLSEAIVIQFALVKAVNA